MERGFGIEFIWHPNEAVDPKMLGGGVEECSEETLGMLMTFVSV